MKHPIDNQYRYGLCYDLNGQIVGFNLSPDVFVGLTDDDIEKALETYTKQKLGQESELCEERKNCTHRHENGNCLSVGGFCLAVDNQHCQLKKEPCEDAISRQSVLDKAKYWIAMQETKTGYIEKRGYFVDVDDIKALQPVRSQGFVHIDDIYRLISGHSNYHGDNILAALTCLAEGKEVPNPITALSIQPEPVIICKDCNEWHRGKNRDGSDLLYSDEGYCSINQFITGENYFCRNHIWSF